MGWNPSTFKHIINCPNSFKVLEIDGQRVQICADLPVENVSWDDAVDFINVIGRRFKAMEIASVCRRKLSSSMRFEVGLLLPIFLGDDEAGSEHELFGSLHADSPGGKFKRANAFGIYRSSFWEWTSDWNGDYPTGGVTADPFGPPAVYDVIRGGSWRQDVSSYRSSFRYNGEGAGDDLGFRLVRMRTP